MTGQIQILKNFCWILIEFWCVSRMKNFESVRLYIYTYVYIYDIYIYNISILGVACTHSLNTPFKHVHLNDLTFR